MHMTPCARPSVATLLTAVGMVVALLVPAGANGQAPEMPKPGPEHDVLKLDAGTWEAVVEMTMAPDTPMQTSKGVEVNTIGCGGLCLITDFKGELMPGVQFQGHGVATWDALKKKYSGAWTDSMSSGLATSEGTWDAKAKKATGWIESPNMMTGTVVKMRTVVEYPADGKRVMTAFAPGPDGKDMQVMRITYTRRK